MVLLALALQNLPWRLADKWSNYRPSYNMQMRNFGVNFGSCASTDILTNWRHSPVYL